MAKIYCINDYKLYAEMVGLMLERKGGHEVIADILPLDMAEIEAFGPDLIILNLVRKLDSLGAGGMHDFDTEVEGARALKFVNAAPALSRYPVVITAMAVLERDLPKGLRYEAFVEVPQKLDNLLEIIEKIVRTRDKGHPLLPD
jgi:hypothetical protein